MRLILAPMEGVMDYTMRDLLTRIGGYDRCVTEFVRVTREVLPPRVFYRACPELHHGSKTPSGVPVYVQLLGGRCITWRQMLWLLPTWVRRVSTISVAPRKR